MATLIDSPSYTQNEVYELAQTDPLEGASTGASFGGIGISNQPHQQLANRTAFLYQRQNTNIDNITVLQGQVATLFARNTWTNTAVFTGPGSYDWVVPGGISTVRAVVVGGGGGGSSCSAMSIAGFASGGGGGGGGYCEGLLSVSPGMVLSITVGAGGAAQSEGGTSRCQSLTATGGAGAFFQTAGSSAGAAGGSASGGNLNFEGATGSDGQSGQFIFAGNGGDGPWGGGGRAGDHGGTPGTAPGAGGGGSYDPFFTGAYFAGAAGAPGIVIICW